MNFISTSAFWFLATLPVVVVFYLLKRKRVTRLVASTILWQRFLAENQANAPFQKLRHNWLMILQLLLLAIVILALARPYFSGQAAGGRRLVVILDASASMQSTDVAPSRFEAGRREALRLVDGLAPTDEMVVLIAGAVTEVRQSSTTEKSALRRALQNATVSDAPARIGEALKLSQTLIKDKSNDKEKPEIHLFSDGAFKTLEEFENRALPVIFHPLGERALNAGIINLDVRQNPENAEQRAVFVTVGNAGTNAIETQMELRFNEQLLEVKPVRLGPRESAAQVFVTAQTKDGSYQVRLTGHDDLAVDDEASVVSLMPQPVKVLLVTQGNRFLEKALRSVANVELTQAADFTEAGAGQDVVVLDNVRPSVWPKASILSFRSAATNWFTVRGAQASPTIVDWRTSHPLLRFVSFDNVQIGESLEIETPTWAGGVVDSAQTPLMIAGELGRQRIVWAGFDLLQTSWPLRVSFPIFVANAMEWLNPASLQASRLSVAAGTPIRLSVGDEVKSAEVQTPDGSLRTVAVDATRHEVLFGDTQRRGIYRLRAGTNTVMFAVNLLDAGETMTPPSKEIELGKYTKTTGVVFRQASLEIWRWIALAALAVCLWEWWYYHRRTV